MDKLCWAAAAIVLAAFMFVAGLSYQEESEIQPGTCVPIYYSGLECCKN